MIIKQLYNDKSRKLPNEYGDVSVMYRKSLSKAAMTAALPLKKLVSCRYNLDSFVVFNTRRFMSQWCHALLFVLVFCFSVLLSLGEGRASWSMCFSVHLSVYITRVNFCPFLFLLVPGIGCGF